LNGPAADKLGRFEASNLQQTSSSLLRIDDHQPPATPPHVKLSLAIAVADDEVDMRDFYRRILVFLGHRVVAIATSGRELVDQCRQQRPELIITDITMPEMNGDEAVREICRHEPLPVILVSARHDVALVARSANDYVMAYLVKPVGRKDLDATITRSVRRFDGFRRIRLEASNPVQAADDREYLERAAATLMRREAIDEGEAYVRLDAMATERNQRLAEAARAVADSTN
jgi:response regulator NasT